jgi:hypothetical protein
MMSESDVLAGLTRRGMLQQLMDNISDNIHFKDAPTAISLRKNTSQWRIIATAQPVIGIEEKERVGQAYDVFPG